MYIKFVLFFGVIFLFVGCMSKQEREIYNFYHKPSESLNITNVKEECVAKGQDWEVQIFPDGSGLCVNKKTREDELTQKAKQLEQYASYEKNYLNEYDSLKKTFQQPIIKWVQPKNKKEPCKVACYFSEDLTKDNSYKLFWDGSCENGYAQGLGREIEKGDLIDRWQIGIYKDGKPNGYGMMYDNLYDLVIEGEMNYDDNKLDYQVHRKVIEKNEEINVIYRTGAMSSLLQASLYIETSPFGNGTLVLKKAYPNFYYQFRDFIKNDTSSLEFAFEIIDKKTNKQNGWGYSKYKNQKIIKGEYINGIPTERFDLPDEYMLKAESIINEIKGANNRALESQEKAQIIKKQYINKICKDSIKVDYMDNNEYKVVCNNQKEKELYSKIHNKLERLSKEKIAKLEQQRFNQQQAQEERYRQEQLSIEKQKLEQQRRQATAAEEANNQRSWDSVNQSIQNLNTNIYMQNQNFQMMELNKNLHQLRPQW
jgi:hypothetical protein